MTDNVLASLQKYIAHEVLDEPNRVIQPDESLLASGLIDSFHLVDLALFIEDITGVLISDSDLNSNVFDTLNQLTALINQRRTAK